MQILENFIFFDNATSGESNILTNPNLGSQLVIQVTGTTFDIEVLGQADINGDFVALSAINQTNFGVGSHITAAGIYAISVGGIGKIKVRINSATGGVTVFGKLCGD